MELIVGFNLLSYYNNYIIKYCVIDFMTTKQSQMLGMGNAKILIPILKSC